MHIATDWSGGWWILVFPLLLIVIAWLPLGKRPRASRHDAPGGGVSQKDSG